LLSIMASINRRRGSAIWTAFFRDQDGRQHCRSTQSVNRKLAQKIADQYEAAGRNKRTLRQLAKVLAQMHELVNGESVERVSLRAFITEWLELRKPQIAPRTWDSYRDRAHKLLRELGERADQPIAQITKRDLVGYRNTLALQLAPSTVNHHLRFVKTLFKSARRDELIADDPSQLVDPLRRSGVALGSNSPRPVFSPEQLQAVLRVADPEWRSMVLFGIYTGQRLGDIAAFCWANLDLEAGQIRFVTAKTHRTMILPMAPALARHVLGLSAPDSLMAPLHPRAYATLQAQGRTGSLSNQFSDLLAQAGLKPKATHHKIKDRQSVRRASSGLSFHSLRHSATSFLHAAGIPAAVAQAFVGHDSEAIHQLYTHIGTESLQKAANALPELL
jgi:integrase